MSEVFTDCPTDTKLADRTAALEARESSIPAPPASPIPPTSTKPERTSTPVRGKPSSPAPPEQSPSDNLSRLRLDLATTQKARASLQSQVDELNISLKALELQNRSSTSQISLLTRQKTDVERRLRDRDEELRGKAKLAESAQDEMVAQGLQLNMAEEKAKRLERENKDLVERWMKRKGEEADRLNKDSNWN